MRDPKKYPIVMVTWLDSQGGNHWEFEKDLKDDYELPLVETFGAVVKDKPEYLTIASSFMGNEPPFSNQFHGLMTIPKCSIKAVYRLDLGIPFKTKDKK